MAKKKLFIWGVLPSLIICTLIAQQFSSFTYSETNPALKKIIIFTSSGGGGHESASKAITNALSNDYAITQTYIFADILTSLDPLGKISFGQTSAERTYNFFIRKKWYRTLNVMSKFGTWFFKFHHTRVTKYIATYLQQENPDLVISVVPHVNGGILQACQENNVPFLLIPTDLDLRIFISNIKCTNYNKFHLSLPFDDPDIINQIQETHIPTEQISVNGFPIRQEFFTPKDRTAIKETFNLPDDKPIILVLMGAAGSNALYYYAKKLTKTTNPLHAIFVLGRNERLRKSIESLKLPSTMSMTVLGFTPHIAKLMTVSDLCITKSGSASFCETLYSDLPMLLDGTTTSIKWEKMNHEFVQKHAIGTVINYYNDIPQIIDTLLANHNKLATMKFNIQNLHKPCLLEKLPYLVQSLLETNNQENKHVATEA